MTKAEFTVAAGALQDWVGKLGWRVPAFKSPPGGEATRTLRHNDEAVIIAVKLGDRSTQSVIADMVDGVLVANGRAIGGPDRRSLIRVANQALGAHDAAHA